MPWPAAGFFTGFATQGQLRQALDDLLERARAQVGADGVANATLASDAVTGTSAGSLRLYGQGATADDLASLATANYAEGQIVELRIGDVGQPITVKHAGSPGAGQFVTRNGLDYVLGALEQRIAFERTGAYWTETERRGKEASGLVSSYGSGWTALPGARAELDETGEVVLTGAHVHTALAAATSTILTLRAGCRPSATRHFTVTAQVDGVVEVLDVQVATNGAVQVVRAAGAPPSVAVTVWLDPVRFRAEG
ncbi:MAG: hypothetical protein DCC71_02895 [Proteobacteria bacterium]|nr:MAG: hypothetical protein DCC71_02895 [Pseudomonadota bacterium]